MRRLIKRHGPCGIDARRWSPYEALTRAIAHQQLNGRAAQTILGRFVALFGDGRFPTPAQVLGHASGAPAHGRGSREPRCARSRTSRATRWRARCRARRAAAALDDDAIIERLTAVRGVGRWTVEMLLIFTSDARTCCRSAIRRAEGFAGVRKRRAHAELRALGAVEPYRSVATWYLWRAATSRGRS